MNDIGKVNQAVFRSMGAAGTMVVGNSLQVAFGTRSENLKSDMDEYSQSTGGLAAPAPAQAPAAAKPVAALPDVKRRDVLALREALGGRHNVRSVRFVAGTRLAVELADPAKLDQEAARPHGVRFVLPLGQGRFQLLIGPEADLYAEALLLPELSGPEPSPLSCLDQPSATVPLENAYADSR